MSQDKRLGTLAVVLMAIAVIPVSAPTAWAQSKYKVLHKFTLVNQGKGVEPVAGVILDQAGNLYGTTWMGGPKGSGTVFELTHNSDGSWSESVLYDFCSLTNCSDGSGPSSGLIFDQAGNLYGATQGGGGASGGGTVFKLTPNGDGSWSESVLYNFCSLTSCTDGARPYASLIFDQAGNLYGTTLTGGNLSPCGGYGCGVVFKLAPNSDGTWTESVLHTFCSLGGCRDGEKPTAGVIFDGAGNLYGTTELGGNPTQCGGTGCGLVYQLTPGSGGSWTESVLHSFCSLSGCGGINPLGGVILDQGGNLYGTAVLGGKGHEGVVFQLTPQSGGSWNEKVLHRFTGGIDGAAPYAGVIFDAAGNLYGTTLEGGRGDAGVVFKLAPDSKGGWSETVLHAFVDNPGALPYAGVIFDGTGNLYGTTYGDSNSTFGSVYEITP
jgi:uncharacterized repeat protein (TIGR03803 family)